MRVGKRHNYKVTTPPLTWTPSPEALTKLANDVFTPTKDNEMSTVDKVQESLDLYRDLRAMWFSGQGAVPPEQALAEHDARMAELAEELFSYTFPDIEI